jgi:potassium efflux system protein
MAVPGSTSRSTGRRVPAAIGLGCILASALPAFAQVAEGRVAPQEAPRETAPEPADTTREHTPRPIPAPEIARRAETDITELSLIRELLQPERDVARIAKQFADEAEDRRRLVEMSSADLRSSSARKLDDLRSRWSAEQDVLKTWENRVAQRAAALDGEHSQMQRIRADWMLTVEFADSAGLPPALVDRARSIVATTDTLELQFGERFSAVLRLQNRIADGLIEAAEMQARIRAAEDMARQRLLVRESVPLWEAVGEDDDSGALAAQVRFALADDVATVARYAGDHGQDLINQILFFLLVLGSMLWLSRRRRSWPPSILEDDAMAASIRAVGRPVSAALLLALWLTPTFQPRRPDAVASIVQLAAIVPVLRLLPERLRETLRTTIYGLTVLYVLTVVYSLAPPQSLFPRLTLLALTSLALVGLLWITRPGSRLGELRRRRGWRAVFALSRLGAAGLALSLVANTIGNVSLSETLTLGTVNAALLAVLVYALAWLLRGLWRLLLRSRVASKSKVVRRERGQIDRVGSALINGLAGLLWLYWTLRLLRLWIPLVEWLQAALATSFTLGSVTIAVGGVLAFVAVLVITTLASRMMRVVLAEDVLSRTKLPRGLPGTISTVVHYGIITLGFLLALAAAGIELGRLVVLAGALGVGIGFGLQDIVRNFVSGLVLAFERPFAVGDVVEVGPLMGKVRRIGARSSTIRTYDGADVIVPNSNLVSDRVINWTLTDIQRRITISVGVAYGSDPERVLEVLRAVADGHPEVTKYPEPMALFRGFGDSALQFELRFWISDVDTTLRTGSAMTKAVHDALQAAGITIPFPQRDLHLRTMDPNLKPALDPDAAISSAPPVSAHE